MSAEDKRKKNVLQCLRSSLTVINIIRTHACSLS